MRLIRVYYGEITEMGMLLNLLHARGYYAVNNL